MKKKLIIMMAAAALVIALLLAGLPLLSRLLFGRSMAASLFARQLHKEAYTTAEGFEALLAEKRSVDSTPYELPSGVTLFCPIEERQYGALPCFVLRGSDAPERLVIYFAGGSFTDPPREVHWTFLDALAADTGAAVAVPIYPRLPDHDAAEAYAAVSAFYDALTDDISARELVFMGDSAGGGMALSFAMQLRDAGLPGPDKLVLICPWVDVTMENPDIPAFEARDPALDSRMLAQLGALWAGGLSPVDPIVSPLYGSLEGLGHITLITTTGELLYPDVMLLDAALTDAGIEHETIAPEDLFHVWPLYASFSIPEAKETYADIVRAVMR